MRTAVIWTQPGCEYCSKAKVLLLQHKYTYTEKLITAGYYTKKELLMEVPNATTVPQIFIDNRYIGGYEDLVRKLRSHDSFRNS